ncbi:MAG TPA: hypothetical protein VIL42_10680 [Sphingomicrobium sp.]|jgi:hypothetical protein
MRPEAKTFRTKAGKEYVFLFSFAGIVAAEDAANASFSDLIAGAANSRVGYLAALIYGGLKACQPELTLADVWELMQSEDGTALGAAMWPAIEAAMPRRTGENPQKAGSGTGSRSSPSGAKKSSGRRTSGGKARAASPSSSKRQGEES